MKSFNRREIVLVIEGIPANQPRLIIWHKHVEMFKYFKYSINKMNFRDFVFIIQSGLEKKTNKC